MEEQRHRCVVGKSMTKTKGIAQSVQHNRNVLINEGSIEEQRET